MAIHHPTPPFSGGERPRLPWWRGITEIVTPSAQVGPVTQAIRAMRAPTWHLHAADRCTPAVQHADDAIEAIRDGLIRYFVEDGSERQRGRDLRRRIADRIEADIALLDALDSDADHEPDLDREPDEQDGCASEWAGCGAHRFNVGRAA